MITGFSSRSRITALAALLIVFWIGSINHATASEAGKKVFQSNCAACHTIGKGKLVGPDLKGVTSRREEDWLKRQIKEPDKLIEEGDPIALQLLREADDIPMPPPEISDSEVAAVIAYLKSTASQANVTVGLPSQYLPTVIISLILLLGLTWIGLRAGKKNVDVS